ncbi:S-layer family protein [Gallibacterium anatis]|uniref:S-layer family protein n=1 Tax=Gallibacterium anatis TaxID=750 RepID=A0A930Y597_9PAST|nr:S-layer family protein [Gallibacterium anatis]
MFDALRADPQRMLKRLGDGFEQRLINEQINQLTGQRYLPGYTNDLEQYKALMNNGIHYAKRFDLQLGVALTPEQMSLLTNDVVSKTRYFLTIRRNRNGISPTSISCFSSL